MSGMYCNNKYNLPLSNYFQNGKHFVLPLSQGVFLFVTNQFQDKHISCFHVLKTLFPGMELTSFNYVLFEDETREDKTPRKCPLHHKIQIVCLAVDSMT